MLKGLITRADKEGLRLAPFIGIGCPGIIEPDGTIDRGAQNLPGNWESSRFNLPLSLHKAIPKVGDHETAVLFVGEVPGHHHRGAEGFCLVATYHLFQKCSFLDPRNLRGQFPFIVALASLP